MKRIPILLVLLIGVVSSLQAQVVRTFTFTAASSGVVVGEVGAGITQHILIWNGTGTVSTCSVKLEKSATGSGGWTDLIAAQTCTTNGASALTTGTANYVRVTLSTFSGGGGLSVRYLAFPPGQALTATVDTTGLALASNQTDGSQKAQVCDAGGDCATVTGSKLDVNASGTSDTDDGTVAGGQTTGLQIGMTYVWDGSNWKRSTIGTAGTASTQVITVQGITSMTKLLVTPDSVALPANQSVNVAQINGVTPLMGAGNTGTGSPRMTIASDQASIPVAATLTAETTKVIGTVRNKYADGTDMLNTDIAPVASSTAPIMSMNSATANGGVNAAAACTFDDVAPTSITENSFGMQRCSTNRNVYTTLRDAAGNERGANINASNQLLTAPTLQAGTALAGEFVPVTTATTTDTALRCTLISAASTNATNCKASAGNVYGYRFVNTTATLYYLRMYNASGTPTCSSATGFIETIPIPASATGAGIVAIEPMGEGYTTGIAFCFTGGSSSTDNTNAATGVFGTILYK